MFEPIDITKFKPLENDNINLRIPKMSDANVKPQSETPQLPKESSGITWPSTHIKNALNSPTGRKITGAFDEITTNVPLRYTASVIESFTGFFPKGSKINEAGKDLEERWLLASMDERNNMAQQMFYASQSSGFQTLLGVALSLIPGVGVGVSSTYWAMLSAEEQRGRDRDGDGEPDGEVYSLINMGIDVVLDSFLGKSVGRILGSGEIAKIGLKGLVAELNKNGLVEAGTEVAQSLLKFANDYRIANGSEERALVIQDTVEYLQREMAIEFVSSYVSGVVVAGATVAVDPIIGKHLKSNEKNKAKDMHVNPVFNVKDQDNITKKEQAKINEYVEKSRKTYDYSKDVSIIEAQEIAETNYTIEKDFDAKEPYVSGDIIFHNPETITAREDLVDFILSERTSKNLDNTVEAVEKAREFQDPEILQKIEEIEKKLNKEEISSEEVAKQVAYEYIDVEKRKQLSPDLYNAIQADLDKTKARPQAEESNPILETKRRYTNKNYTNKQAEARLIADFKTYRDTGKFPSNKLKKYFDATIKRLLENTSEDGLNDAFAKDLVDKRPKKKTQRVPSKTETKKKTSVVEKIRTKEANSLLDKVRNLFGDKEVVMKDDIKNLELSVEERAVLEDILEQHEFAGEVIETKYFLDMLQYEASNEYANKMLSDNGEDINSFKIKDKDIYIDKELIASEQLNLGKREVLADNQQYTIYRGAGEENIIVAKSVEAIGALIEFTAVERGYDYIIVKDGSVAPMTTQEIEARKYETADEFVKAQPGETVYRGGEYGDDIFATPRKELAKNNAGDSGRIHEFKIDKNNVEFYTPSKHEEYINDVWDNYSDLLELEGDMGLFDDTIYKKYKKLIESGKLDDSFDQYNLKPKIDNLFKFLENQIEDYSQFEFRQLSYRDMDGVQPLLEKAIKDKTGKTILARPHDIDGGGSWMKMMGDKQLLKEGDFEYIIGDTSNIKTKSQLIEIWNKAHSVKDGDTKSLKQKMTDAIAKENISLNTIFKRTAARLTITAMTKLNTGDQITMSEYKLLKISMKALSRGAKWGWADAKATLSLAFQVQMTEAKEIRNAVARQILTLDKKDQGRFLIRLSNITGKKQVAQIENIFNAITELKDKRERQGKIKFLKDFYKNLVIDLSPNRRDSKINVKYNEVMKKILDEYVLFEPSKKTLAAVEELHGILSMLSKEQMEDPIARAAEGYIEQLGYFSKRSIKDLSLTELSVLHDMITHLAEMGYEIQEANEKAKNELAAQDFKDLTEDLHRQDSTDTSDANRKSKNEIKLGRFYAMTVVRVMNRFDGLKSYTGPFVERQRRLSQRSIEAESRFNVARFNFFRQLAAINDGKYNLDTKEMTELNFFLMAEQPQFVNGQLVPNQAAQHIFDMSDWVHAPVKTEKMQKLLDLYRSTIGETATEMRELVAKIDNKAMGITENYFPMRRDGSSIQTLIEPISPYVSKSSMPSANWTKSRKIKTTYSVVANPTTVLLGEMRLRYHYLETAETLDELRRALNYKEAIEMEDGNTELFTFQDKAGYVITEYLKRYIDTFSRMGHSKDYNYSAFANTIRRNTSLAVMGFSPISAALQVFALADATILGVTMYGPELSARIIGKLFTEAFRPNKFRTLVAEESAALRVRAGNIELGMQDTIVLDHSANPVTQKFNQARNFLASRAFEILKLPDVHVAASVQQATKEFLMKRKGLDPIAANLEADFFMNLVSGSSELADRPLYLGINPVYQLAGHFQTFVLNRWDILEQDLIRQNLLRPFNTKEGKYANVHGGDWDDLTKRMVAIVALFLFGVAKLTEEFYQDQARKLVYGKEIKKTKSKFVTGQDASVYEDFAFSFLEMFPFFGDSLRGLREGREFGNFMEIPALRPFEQLPAAIYKISEAIAKDDKENLAKGGEMLAKAMGAMFGIAGSGPGVSIASQFIIPEGSSGKGSKPNLKVGPISSGGKGSGPKRAGSIIK